MSSPEDDIIEEEMREYWWAQGEAVMREMCEDNDGEQRKARVDTSAQGQWLDPTQAKGRALPIRTSDQARKNNSAIQNKEEHRVKR